MDIYMKMFRKDEGFTLVELMVVVLIIGILVAIAVPVFLNASASAKAKSCQANQRTIVGAIQTFNAQNADAQITTATAAGTIDTGSDGYAALFGAAGTIKTPPKCSATGGGMYTGYGPSVASDKASPAASAKSAGTADFLKEGTYDHALGQ